jgi:hypothetical protein
MDANEGERDERALGYRTPARLVHETLLSPSWKLLLAPLLKANLVFGALFATFVLWKLLNRQLLEPEDRFVYPVRLAEEVSPLFVMVSPLVAMAFLRRRIRSAWHLLSRRARARYLVGVAIVQLALMAGAAVGLFVLSFDLFGPDHVTSAIGPGLRRADVYTVGHLDCGYDVYLAQPFSFVGKRILHRSRAHCDEPAPKVLWIDPDHVELTDPNGQVLEDQSSPAFNLFRSGC